MQKIGRWIVWKIYFFRKICWKITSGLRNWTLETKRTLLDTKTHPLYVPHRKFTIKSKQQCQLGSLGLLRSRWSTVLTPCWVVIARVLWAVSNNSLTYLGNEIWKMAFKCPSCGSAWNCDKMKTSRWSSMERASTKRIQLVVWSVWTLHCNHFSWEPKIAAVGRGSEWIKHGDVSHSRGLIFVHHCHINVP